MRHLLLAAAALVFLGWPSPAGAQEVAIEEEEARSSILLGGGLGFGGLAFSVDGEEAVSYDAIGFQLAFGGMISPSLALGIDFTALGARDEGDDGGDDLDVFERAVGVWGRYWVIPRLWLQAGLASVRAGASSDFEEYPTYDGAQIHGAAGFEVLHRPNWAIDVSLRLAAAGYGDESDVGGSFASQSAALLVGFAWFR